MNEYKLSNRAKKCLNENEVLYYFKTEDVVSVVLIDNEFPNCEILLRNFITSDTIHFEGNYSLGSIILGNNKKNKNKNFWWKSNHKFFTKYNELFWENKGFVPIQELSFC